MPTPPLNPPTERFAALTAWLGKAVAAAVARGLTGPLIVLIWQRVNRISHRFARLAERIRRGRPARKTPAAPHPGRGRPIGRPNPLPSGFGWLLRLVPETAASASQLQFLLADKEMAALIAAAPGPAGRALRPLCRMLGVRPPEILALPTRPPKPRKPRQPRPKREPLPPAYPPTRPDAPAWMRLVSPKQLHTTRWPWLRQPRRPRTT